MYDSVGNSEYSPYSILWRTTGKNNEESVAALTYDNQNDTP